MNKSIVFNRLFDELNEYMSRYGSDYDIGERLNMKGKDTVLGNVLYNKR